MLCPAASGAIAWAAILMFSLHFGGHRFTAPQQRIAAQGDHDPHLECLL